MAVGVGHEFVGLLARRVQRERMVHVVMHRERHRRIRAIDAGTRGINEVLHAIMSTSFKDMREAEDVAVYIGQGVVDGVPNTGLCSKIDYSYWLMISKSRINGLLVSQINT